MSETEKGHQFSLFLFICIRGQAGVVEPVLRSRGHLALRLRLPWDANTALQMVASAQTEAEMGALVTAVLTTS